MTLQTEQYETVDLRCESCQARSVLPIPVSVVENSKGGLVTIQIPAGVTCEHAYSVYVDRQFRVRGYTMADYSIGEKSDTEIPPDEVDFSTFSASAFETDEGKSDVTLDPDENFRSIQRMLGQHVFIPLLHAIITGEEVILLFHDEMWFNTFGTRLDRLASHLTGNDRTTDRILEMTRDEYKNHQIPEGHHPLVLDVDTGIILDSPFKDETFNFETSLMKKISGKNAGNEGPSSVFRRESLKVASVADSISLKVIENGIMSEKEILKFVRKNLGIDFPPNYISTLKNFVRNHHGAEASERIGNTPQNRASRVF